MSGLLTSHLQPEAPDFLDLPWHLPLTLWEGACDRLERLPRGESRHPVVFVAYEKAVYALKEMGPGQAEAEYLLLRSMAERALPVVQPIGHLSVDSGEPRTVLITRFLDHSIPYHSLFLQSSLSRYREHLLDALASLLVQLHLSHVFWGDCSLFNTLFVRDAGALQAYLVDAETSQVLPALGDGLRQHDLELMEENVTGGLMDLVALGALPPDFPALDLARDIRHRYDNLWVEVNRVELFGPDERFKITERVRALNKLGFSVGELELSRAGDLDRLELRVQVTDRSFHRRLLHSLTGLEVQEQQAILMVNEIRELRAELGRSRGRSLSLGAAAYTWLEERYLPAVRAFSTLGPGVEPPRALLSPAGIQMARFRGRSARHRARGGARGLCRREPPAADLGYVVTPTCLLPISRPRRPDPRSYRLSRPGVASSCSTGVPIAVPARCVRSGGGSPRGS